MKLAIIYQLDSNNNTTHIKIWVEAKAVLREKCIVFDVFTLKQEKK